VIRPAGVDDLGRLLDLEKAASTAGLAHVFGPDIPFPDDDVLARWRLVLEEPGVTVVIDEADGQPIGYAAYGDGWLRHFGYLPAWWGTGRAQALHDYVAAAMRADNPDQADHAGRVDDPDRADSAQSADRVARPLRLWVLVDNHRARAFYARLGWTDSGVRDREVFPPYPDKMELLLQPPRLP
jgi:RimJ/RimL family protein N-acetyltransferase